MKLKELPSAPAENQDCVSLLLATHPCVHQPRPSGYRFTDRRRGVEDDIRGSELLSYT